MFSNSITKVSIFYYAQTTNNSHLTMSEGALFFIFTRDFQNVDRSRSETKELMSK